MYQFRTGQHLPLHTGGFALIKAHHHVQVARFQGLQQLATMVGTQLETHGRVRLTAATQGDRQQLQAKRRTAAYTPQPFMVRAQIARQSADVIQILMQARHVRRQDAGLACGDQAAPHAVKQPKSQLHFRRCQHLAGRRLGDMQQLRGLCQ